MSSGRLFQSFGPAEANERSPTVTRRDGRTSSWLEVADLTDPVLYSDSSSVNQLDAGRRPLCPIHCVDPFLNQIKSNIS